MQHKLGPLVLKNSITSQLLAQFLLQISNKQTVQEQVMGAAKSAAITGGAVGAMGAVLLAPLALSTIGFTSAGIAAGSYAASMMSAAAKANGGGVAAGSLVAILQSAGAAGFTTTTNMVVACIGSAFGASVGWLSHIFQRRKEERKKEMAITVFAISAVALFIWSKR